MAVLPHPWDAYASAQAQLSTRTSVSDRSWGLEAALNRLVVPIPPNPAQLATVRASAERRARHSRALIVRNAAELRGEAPSFDEQMKARSDLIFLERHLSKAEMATLLAVGLGHSDTTHAGRQRLSRARRRARMLLIK